MKRENVRSMDQGLEGAFWDFQVLVSRKNSLDEGCMDSGIIDSLLRQGKTLSRM